MAASRRGMLRYQELLGGNVCLSVSRGCYGSKQERDAALPGVSRRKRMSVVK